jgi:hypothetical protein
MRKKFGGSRPLSLIGGLMAFVLSAVMGVGFVVLVDKTHDLFSGAAFAEQTVVGSGIAGVKQ